MVRRALLALGALALAYLAGAWVYWPSMRPVAGVRQPMHYNESYVWPRPWTLAETAPPARGPTPVGALWGENRISQSFTACAANLAMVRVWLAATAGTPEVRVRLMVDDRGAEGPVQPTWAAPLFEGRVRVQGAGRYYAFAFQPVAFSQGQRYLIQLSAPGASIDAPVVVRVGQADPVGGLLYVNEVRAAGDLDMGALYRGWPGLWTLRVLGERVAPRLVRARIAQYKPSWAKGATWSVLIALLCAGSVALIGLSWPARRGAVVGTGALIGITLLFFGWRDVRAALGTGDRRAALAPDAGAEAAALAERALATRHLLADLEWAAREPEPRWVQAAWAAPQEGLVRPALTAPGVSRAGFRVQVPPDGDLFFWYARSGGAGAGWVTVQGETVWRSGADGAMQTGADWQEAAVDLLPWAGQTIGLAFHSQGEGEVLWADPQIISTRSWLRPYPLENAPQGLVLSETLFGQAEIELLGYAWERAADRITLTLAWRALAPVGRDYTMFVHALDGEGRSVGQHDARPLAGAYPTFLWPAGHVIVDRVTLSVDAPAQRLAVGLYDLGTMERLPARQASGEPWANNQLLIEVAP